MIGWKFAFIELAKRSVLITIRMTAAVFRNGVEPLLLRAMRGTVSQIALVMVVQVSLADKAGDVSSWLQCFGGCDFGQWKIDRVRGRNECPIARRFGPFRFGDKLELQTCR